MRRNFPVKLREIEGEYEVRPGGFENWRIVKETKTITHFLFIYIAAVLVCLLC
jgi:hypothetical protein